MSLHTRSLKYGKLQGGVLVEVAPSLMRRLKQHFHRFDFGVKVRPTRTRTLPLTLTLTLPLTLTITRTISRTRTRTRTLTLSLPCQGHLWYEWLRVGEPHLRVGHGRDGRGQRRLPG